MASVADSPAVEAAARPPGIACPGNEGYYLSLLVDNRRARGSGFDLIFKLYPESLSTLGPLSRLSSKPLSINPQYLDRKGFEYFEFTPTNQKRRGFLAELLKSRDVTFTRGLLIIEFAISGNIPARLDCVGR